jgi:hypothetical protein
MTTLHLRKSINRSPLRRGLSLVPFSLAPALAVSALITFVPINTRADTCTPPPPNMISWWPGDGNANDIQGSNNGTLLNGATFAPGMVDQAFSFAGADDEISIAHTSALNFGPNDSFTVDAWLKPLIQYWVHNGSQYHSPMSVALKPSASSCLLTAGLISKSGTAIILALT